MANRRLAYLFPGQGAQHPGMAKSFYEGFSQSREVFEEAEDVLKYRLTDIVMNGSEAQLTETRYAQPGIFVASVAILRALQHLFPALKPQVCAGLSLGEYTAVAAAGYVPFAALLPAVKERAERMHEACEAHPGTMAVVLGLSAKEVEQLIQEVNLPRDLWAANFNCPGQVVISGTLKGIDAGSEAAKKKGAKRVLPLNVHGAFHSGLMASAEAQLQPFILDLPFSVNHSDLVMNVTGAKESNPAAIKQNLIKQVTHPVRWEQGIEFIETLGVDLYLEIGPGQVLSGFNKRIGAKAPTYSINAIEGIQALEDFLNLSP